MDATSLAAVAAVIAAIAGPVGVVIGWVLSRRSEHENWRREDRNRAHAERVTAFGAFLVAIDTTLGWLTRNENRQRAEAILKKEPEQADYDGPDPEAPLQTIAILAPDVEPAADELYRWTVIHGLHQLARNAKRLGVAISDDPPYLDFDVYHERRAAVIAAMRANLGVASSPEPM